MTMMTKAIFGAASLALVAACSGQSEEASQAEAGAALAEAEAAAAAAEAVDAEDFPDTEEFASCVERNSEMVDTGENVEGRATQTIYGFHVKGDNTPLPDALPVSLEVDYPVTLTQYQTQFTVADVNEEMRDGFFEAESARVLVGPNWSYVLISPPETTTQAAANLDLKRACARETGDVSLQLITIKRTL